MFSAVDICLLSWLRLESIPDARVSVIAVLAIAAAGGHRAAASLKRSTGSGPRVPPCLIVYRAHRAATEASQLTRGERAAEQDLSIPT